MADERVDDARERLLSAITRNGRWPEHVGVGSPAGADANAMVLGLAAVPESVRLAREFTRARLGAWDLVPMYDDIALVISELVTNALRHAVGRMGGGAMGISTITVGLLRTAGRVTCAVIDPSDEIPVRAEADFVSQSGRGLHLVDAFSDAWSWTPLEGHGKIVWACFNISRR